MTRSMRSLVFLMLVGCRGIGGDDGKTFGSTTTTTTETSATFIPSAFGITDAQFIVAEGQATELVANMLIVTEDEQSCGAMWTAPGPFPAAPWSATIGAVLAFEIPLDATFSSDCDGEDFPAAWGSKPSDNISRWSWGIAVTATPTADTLERLDPETRENLDGYLLGGGVRFPNTSSDPWSHNAVTWQTVNGDIQPVELALVDGALTSGAFDLLPQTLFTPAEALLPEPE